MEKRLLVAVVLSLGILLIWQAYFVPPPQTPTKRSISSAEVPSSLESTEIGEQSTKIQPEETADEQVEASDQAGISADTVVAEAPDRVLKVTSKLFVVELASQGAHIISWKLPNYADQKGEALELIPSDLAEYFPGDVTYGENKTFSKLNYFIDLPDDEYQLDPSHPILTVNCNTQTASGVKVIKKFVFHHDQFVVDFSVKIVSGISSPLNGSLAVYLPDRLMNDVDKKDKNRFTKTGPLVMVGGEREVPKIKKLSSRWVYPEMAQWVAVQEGFFFAGIVPISPQAKAFVEPTVFDKEHKHPLFACSGLLWENQLLNAGGVIEKQAKLLLGPKKFDLLKSYQLGIENIISFGWFSWLGKLFYYVLISTSSVVKNYGLAIIILTVAIKIILFPLSHISLKSMKKMQEIQPQMKEIQQRYRKDPRKQQEELTKLYRKHGVNPMSGCLPMLVQFPVFIALYQVLINSIEMRGAAFLWASDLSKPDVPLVLIMGVSMLLQQKMSPTGGDPRQAKMMMFMPILFTAMFWSFPSGLVLYWLMNNILTIIQQYFMNLKSGGNDQTKPRMKARTLKKLAEKNIQIES